MKNIRTYNIFDEKFTSKIYQKYYDMQQFEEPDVLNEGFFCLKMNPDNCPSDFKALLKVMITYVEQTCQEYISNYKCMPPYYLSKDVTFCRYPKGTFHKMHIDRAEDHSIAALLYLNTIESGGETFFPDQDIKQKPEAGKLVVFPMSFVYPHASLPSKEEEDRIIARFSYFADPWDDDKRTNYGK